MGIPRSLSTGAAKVNFIRLDLLHIQLLCLHWQALLLIVVPYRNSITFLLYTEYNQTPLDSTTMLFDNMQLTYIHSY